MTHEYLWNKEIATLLANIVSEFWLNAFANTSVPEFESPDQVAKLPHFEESD